MVTRTTASACGSKSLRHVAQRTLAVIRLAAAS
jgi:hypothetical protein